MPKKVCSYVVLALCLVGVVLGIVLVLVVIKLLVIPLQSKQIPMLKACLVKEISPVIVTGSANRRHSHGQGVKTEKRSNMENEVLPSKKKTKKGGDVFGYDEKTEHFNSVLDKPHHTRHWNRKIGHRQDFWQEDDSENTNTESCFTVRVQFTDEALDQNGELMNVVREAFLKQSWEDGARSKHSLGIQDQNKSFCCGCYGEIFSQNATLTYSGTTISCGQTILCRDLGTRTANTKTKSVNWLLVNAMFWPTLVFIFGFVGLFFAVVHVINENIEHELNQANVRTPLQQIKSEVCK